MRTSLTETQTIERYLLNRMSHEEHLHFEAQKVLDEALDEKVRAQKAAYVVIRHYGREKIREEIEAVHRQLFHSETHRSFKERILRLFRREY